MTKSFDEWTEDTWINPEPHTESNQAAKLGWQARQPEIDALKAENTRLRAALEAIAFSTMEKQAPDLRGLAQVALDKK